MAPRIVIAPRAAQEIDRIAEYIAADNLEAALRFYEAVEKALGRLADLPGLGVARKFKSPRLTGLRMWLIPEFPERLIFYRSIEHGIEVIHVIHSAQDYRRVLEP